MATTRVMIAEQIERRLNGGNASQAAWAKRPELYVAVAQWLNQAMKIDHLQVSMPTGETTPNGLCMATYEGIVVEAWKNTSRVQLPAVPMRLPRNMGLWAIRPNSLTSEQNGLNCKFIPIQLEEAALLENQPMISDLLGQVGYTQKGIYAVFTKDLTLPNEEIKVDIDMVVLDVSQYGDYDILPVPADMEAACIEAVYRAFSGEVPPDKITDPIANKTMARG